MRIIIIFASLIIMAGLCSTRDAHGSTTTTNSPSVSIEPYVYVYGGVHKPGRYGWFDGMTVIDAIKVAGGFTDSASHRIRIIHVDGHRKIVDWDALDTEHPPILQRGDTVSVPKRIL